MGKIADRIAAHYFDSRKEQPTGFSTPMLKELSRAIDEAIGEARILMARECEDAAHKCWENCSHEENMNRIENAAQYDILRDEFKQLARRIRSIEL